MVNYAHRDYSVGVYRGQSIRYGKVPDLALPTNPTRNNNQSDIKFDMEVFEWEKNAKSFLDRIENIIEGKNKLYCLFADKCKPSLKTKLEGTKGCDKAHNVKDGENSWMLLLVPYVLWKSAYMEHVAI